VPSGLSQRQHIAAPFVVNAASMRAPSDRFRELRGLLSIYVHEPCAIAPSLGPTINHHLAASSTTNGT
jgi:hypothetical protein